MATLTGNELLDSLLELEVTDLVTVPDWIQIPLHNAAGERSRDIRTLTCCAEDEAFAAAAGLIVGGRKPVVVIQNQGLYAGVNGLRAVGLDAQMPIVMLIGQFGREFANLEQDSALSKRRVVRMLEPMLRCMEIPYWLLRGFDDLAHVREAFETAWSETRPTALVVERSLNW